MDSIFIRELRLPAWIGLYRREKIAQQTVEIDIEIALPGDAVFASGKVHDTIDYGAVVKRIKAVLSEERFGLVEKLADRVAGIILDEFDSPQVNVSVTKCGVLKEAKKVGVRLERKR